MHTTPYERYAEFFFSQKLRRFSKRTFFNQTPPQINRKNENRNKQQTITNKKIEKKKKKVPEKNGKKGRKKKKERNLGVVELGGGGSNVGLVDPPQRNTVDLEGTGNKEETRGEGLQVDHPLSPESTRQENEDGSLSDGVTGLANLGLGILVKPLVGLLGGVEPGLLLGRDFLSFRHCVGGREREKREKKAFRTLSDLKKSSKWLFLDPVLWSAFLFWEGCFLRV